jgi:tRNA threonylcarbamoyladenosine biosynthesis protein TsaB
MNLILSIESGTNTCSVALSDGIELIGYIESHDQEYNHAKKLTLFIDTLLQRHRIDVKSLKAVAISKGPGSYTGLRIGVSVAKGICYALDIPLLALGSLEVMAVGAIDWLKKNPLSLNPELLCPMIDARRMEVYTQIFDSNINALTNIEAKILDTRSFSNLLENKRILFFGNGSFKAKSILNHINASFADDFKPSARFMISLAWRNLKDERFEDVAYFEPLYLKDFVATVQKNKVIGNEEQSII